MLSAATMLCYFVWAKKECRMQEVSMSPKQSCWLVLLVNSLRKVASMSAVDAVGRRRYQRAQNNHVV